MKKHIQIKKNVAAWGLGLIALAVLIGAGIVYGTHQQNSGDKGPQRITASDQQRTALSSLATEHFDMVVKDLDQAVDGQSDEGAMQSELDSHASKISKKLADIYGEDIGAASDAAWKAYHEQLFAYAKAAKANDAAAKQSAQEKLNTEYIEPLAKALADANAKIDPSLVKAGLGAHISNATNVVDHHLAKNAAAEADEIQQAKSHLTALYDVIAGQ